MMRPETSEAALLQQWERLTRRLAGQYAQIADREDLEQVARIGLLQAARRFDPARGCNFQTFAIPTMDGMLRRFLRNEATGRGIPRRWFDLRPRLKRTQESLARSLGRDPSLDELAAELKVSEDDARGALAVRDLCYPESLDGRPADPEDEPKSPLSDRRGAVDPLLQAVETRLAVRSAIGALPDRLREIVRQRYLEGCSQSRVARSLGLSQIQVSRMERQALNLLRQKMSDRA